MGSYAAPYQSPRQLIWLEIRKYADDFTVPQFIHSLKFKQTTVRLYINSLLKAGFIREVYRENSKVRHYELVHNCGYNAPEIDKNGKPSPLCIKNKAMWNTLRITRAALTSKQLAQFSSTSEFVISAQRARAYLSNLYHAGYLSKTGDKYQLLQSMNTGAKSPMVRKNRQVFDPNINKIMGMKNEYKSTY